MQTQVDSIPASFESDFERFSHCSSDHPVSTKEVEIKYISHHVGVSHKQACSDLERIGECITEALQFLTQNKVGEAVGEILRIHLQRAYQLITEAIQSEVQRNTSLCVLITQVTGRLESEPNIVKTESGQDALTMTGIKDEAMEGYAVADAVNGDGGTDAAHDGCHGDSGDGGDVRTAISKIKEEVEENYDDDDDEDDATDDSDADGGADAFMELSTPSPDEDINTLEHAEESDVTPVQSAEMNNKLNGDEGKLARAFDCPSTPLQGLEPLSAAPQSQETKLILNAISGLSRMMTDTMSRYMQRVDERFDGVEARLHSFEKRLPRSTEDEEDVPRKKRRVQNPKLAEAVRRLHNSKNTPLRYNPEEGLFSGDSDEEDGPAPAKQTTLRHVDSEDDCHDFRRTTSPQLPPAPSPPPRSPPQSLTQPSEWGPEFTGQNLTPLLPSAQWGSPGSKQEFTAAELHLFSMVEYLKHQNDTILSRVNRLMSQISNPAEPDVGEVEVELPMETMTQVEEMESFLKEADNGPARQKMIVSLSTIGGRDVKRVTWNILGRLFSDNVARNISWKGANGKMAFNHMSLKTVTFNAVRRNSLGRNVSEMDIQHHAIRWFNLAADRGGGRRRRMANQEGANQEEEPYALCATYAT